MSDDQPTSEPQAAAGAPAPAASAPAPKPKKTHEKHPIDPTGIPAIVPPTVAVGIACTIYGFLSLGHVVGNWILAIALIVMVAGIILVAGYMELITGAPASAEEDFDEHTLSEDDPRSHGRPSAHDLPLDNPARAELLAKA
jgi:hypothetical protein